MVDGAHARVGKVAAPAKDTTTFNEAMTGIALLLYPFVALLGTLYLAEVLL